MKDHGIDQLRLVNERIRKAKDSLEALKDTDVIKNLQTELVDLIPLGQFPEKETKKPIK